MKLFGVHAQVSFTDISVDRACKSCMWTFASVSNCLPLLRLAESNGRLLHVLDALHIAQACYIFMLHVQLAYDMWFLPPRGAV